MTRTFSPTRIVGGSVIAEQQPFEFEATAAFRGAELLDDPPRARRVVVREPHEYLRGEAHFLDVFQDSVAERLAMAGTVAPQVLHVFGRDGRARALVEEAVSGIELSEVLASLREQRRALPIEVALAIAAPLVGLWRASIERGHLVPIYLGLRQIRVTPTGEIRALPELASERARQDTGAMVMVIDPGVAYLSPEQVEGGYHGSSGMFTLGLILYELLAGNHAVPGAGETSMMETLSKLRAADLAPIQTRRDVPPEVAAFVARAIERDPHARFESWDELTVELDAALGALPPCGCADILAALPDRPLPLPELALDTRWRSLPHDGLAPMTVQLAPAAHRETRAKLALADDYVYGRDGRPMLEHDQLFVDLRPVSVAEFARFLLATRPGSFAPVADDDTAVTGVSFEDACAYAAWAGKRLPSEAEWVAAVGALGAERLGTGAVWEWTMTPDHGGRVVRGGRWRNAAERPASPDNRSYETKPAPDVGFRCVARVLDPGRDS